MSKKPTYQISDYIKELSRLLDVTPARILRRMNLPNDYLEHPNKGVEADMFFQLWCAVEQETGREDLPLFLGQALPRRQFTSQMLAFSCSKTIREGLERLALFKPLIAPIRLILRPEKDQLELAIETAEPEVEIPSGFGLWELVFFLETFRFFTDHKIIPMAINGPLFDRDPSALEAFFGCPIHHSTEIRLVLAAQDADLPLISSNEELWAGIEPTLTRQLEAKNAMSSMAHRVQLALTEILPAGKSTADDVSAHLRLGRRSLQRRLQAEGESFRSVLDATRTSLALRYLSQGDMSVDEISHLLAYRNTNSFYRAFHTWTGMTPMQARTEQEPTMLDPVSPARYAAADS